MLLEAERGQVELEALGEPLHVGDDAELGGDQTETRHDIIRGKKM